MAAPSLPPDDKASAETQSLPPGPQSQPPGPQSQPPGPQSLPPGPQSQPPGPQSLRPAKKVTIQTIFRGAFWMILSGTTARVLGIVGTLALTRFLSPEEYGEASLAALVFIITSTVSSGGISQYLVSRPRLGRDAIFHATFYFLVAGAIAFGLAVAFGPTIARGLHAPGIVGYLPGFAIAAFLDRVAVIQDRVQLRMLRFRAVGMQRSLGELVYSGVSVSLAVWGAGTPLGGAAAVMWGNLARVVVRLISLSITTPRAAWLSPTKLTRSLSWDLFQFGWPMAIVTIANVGAQRFDNVVFQYHFGLAWLAFYNLAYNFADIPGSLVAEQIGDVLVPSFAGMKTDQERKEALLVAMRLTLLILAPMVVGLIAIGPTLSMLAFDRRYQQGIIMLLRLLALLSIGRGVSWLGNSYLQVRNQTHVIMALEVARMVGVVVCMNLFVLFGAWYGRLAGGTWACLAVVFIFSMSGGSYMWAIRKVDRISLRDQIAPLIPPMVATLPMFLAVAGMQRLMNYVGVFSLDHPPVGMLEHLRVYAPRLIIELITGVVTFIPSALLVAPKVSREFLHNVRTARQRHRESQPDVLAPVTKPS